MQYASLIRGEQVYTTLAEFQSSRVTYIYSKSAAKLFNPFQSYLSPWRTYPDTINPDPPITCGVQYTPSSNPRLFWIELNTLGIDVNPAIQNIVAARSCVAEAKKPRSRRKCRFEGPLGRGLHVHDGIESRSGKSEEFCGVGVSVKSSSATTKISQLALIRGISPNEACSPFGLLNRPLFSR